MSARAFVGCGSPACTACFVARKAHEDAQRDDSALALARDAIRALGGLGAPDTTMRSLRARLARLERSGGA